MSWEAGAEERHSVGFMTGVAEIHIGAIRESAPNTGITLPRIESEYGGYRLAGWQRERSSQITERPDYLLPGSTFYPDRDMTLYAIWRSAETEKWHQSTERKTGIYIIGDTWKHCVMRGNVGSDGKIMPAEMPEWETDAEGRRCLSADAETDGEMLYEIRFETGQTARIRHKNTGESVGYSSSSSISLTKTDVSWSWTEIEDGQIRFYHQYESGDVRYLWANEGETLQTIDELRFAAQNFCYTGYGILLFDTADQPAAAVYTYYPLETGVEETRAGVSEVKERRVYSLTGQEMRGKVGRGIWIVVEGDKQQGRVKRLLVTDY